MVVILEEQIYIYDVSTMKLLHTIETLPNPNGLVALSPITENNFLAYPSPPPPANKNGLNLININNAANPGNDSNQQPTNSSITSRVGDVIIFNAKTLQPYCVIEAHKATLAAIALSSDGLLLASASVKGTIIRVFSVETGQKLYQFRRGTYGTKIYSLSFSSDNKFLTASSATETVHIFKLTDEFQVNKLSSETIGLRNGASSAKSRTNSINAKNATTETNTENVNDDVKTSKNQSQTNTEQTKSQRETGNDHNDSSEDEGDGYDVDDDGDEEDVEIEVEDDDEADERNDELGPLPSSSSLRRLSNSSHGSADFDLSGHSSNSTITGAAGATGNAATQKAEPIIDQTRRSVGRLIRKSSQSLGRRAAETMGIYLPKRVTSVLKPIRHFASLKIPASNNTKSIVAINQLNSKIPTSFLEKLKNDPDRLFEYTGDDRIDSNNSHNNNNGSNNGGSGSISNSNGSGNSNGNGSEEVKQNMLEVVIVTSNGLYLKYALDGDRGGDCILLSQYSLLDGGNR